MNAETNSGACSQYEVKLEEHLGGELSSADARNVAEHLKSCVECRGALENAAASVELLRLAERADDPGPAFARNVMARIRLDREAASVEADSKGLWQPFILLAWRLAATASLALALMLTYDFAWHAQTPQTAGTTEIRDLVTSEVDRVPANRDDVLLMVAEANHGNR